MVQEHRSEYPSLWAAVVSIAAKIGCSPHTLLEWVRKVEVDAGVRDGVPHVNRKRQVPSPDGYGYTAPLLQASVKAQQMKNKRSR